MNPLHMDNQNPWKNNNGKSKCDGKSKKDLSKKSNYLGNYYPIKIQIAIFSKLIIIFELQLSEVTTGQIHVIELLVDAS